MVYSGSTIVLFPFFLSHSFHGRGGTESKRKYGAPDLFYECPLVLSETETNN